MRYLYVLGIFTLLTMQAVPAGAQAASAPEILISEINWPGSSQSQADEWIELYNATSTSVDLSGWVLTGSASSGEAIAIAEGTILEADQVLLIANYDTDSEKTTLTTKPNLVTASLSLSNSSQEIFLAMPDGTVVDAAGDGGKPEAGSTDPVSSMERNLDDLSWRTSTESINLSDDAQLGTPGMVRVAIVDTEVAPEETEASSTLTEEQLVACYTMYMPKNVHAIEPEDEEAETAAEIDEPLVEEEVVDNEDVEVAYSTYDAGSIIINEIVSDPQDGEEWIELFNPFSMSIDLTGWTITEGSGKTTPLPEQTLEPHSYLVVETIKGNLNNGGDSMTLTDGAGTRIDSMTYGKNVEAPGKEESLALSADGVWSITDILTPGSANQFPKLTQDTYENEDPDNESTITDTDSQDEYETVSDNQQERSGEDDVVSDQSEVHNIVAIAEAPEEEITQKNTQEEASDGLTSIQGIVTAEPGTFGTQLAFIDGMELYFYRADWPELALGDIVHVVGESSSAWDESRIKISDKTSIEIIGSQELKAEIIDIASVFAQDIGSLVEISGEVFGIDGKKLTVEDSTGQIEIIANERTGMSWSNLTASAYTITGVVRTRNGKVQIYARDWDDVKPMETDSILEDASDNEVVGLTVSDDDVNWLGAMVIGISGGALVYWFVRFKALPEILKQNSASESAP